MKITIVCVGKIKENFYTQAIAEYQKRLSSYCKFEIIEVNDEKTPDGIPAAEELKIKEKEGEKILKSLKENAVIVALAINGDKMSSENFADFINKTGIQGFGHLIFIIGGSLGLSEQVLSTAKYRLSFSDMTFPHQLMRVILTEQIYRAYRIIHGEPYHK